MENIEQPIQEIKKSDLIKDIKTFEQGEENGEISNLDARGEFENETKIDATNFKNNLDSSNQTASLTTFDDGSIFGKFKDAKTLLDAYNSLQAEFTRKCQKLSQLQKLFSGDLNQIKTQNNDINEENTTKNSDLNENNTKINDFCSKTEEVKKVLCDDEFASSLEQKDYFDHNSGNENYKKGITETVGQQEPSSLPKSNQLASNLDSGTESKIADKLNDQQFIDEYILNNEKIKEKIISEYLSKISSGSAVPSIMSGSSTSVMFSPSNGMPKSIKEAGVLLSKMLK